MHHKGDLIINLIRILKNLEAKSQGLKVSQNKLRVIGVEID